MEMVDVYNDKHEKLGYSKERDKLVDGEYRLSCFVWIMNDNDEILIQQRLATAEKCPNMWETASGGAIESDTPISGTLRELEEELGIKASKDELKYLGTFARTKDFVEVFLLKKNVDLNDLKLQKEEVQDAKWAKINEFEELLNAGKASGTSFDVFKKYYENYYNK